MQAGSALKLESNLDIFRDNWFGGMVGEGERGSRGFPRLVACLFKSHFHRKDGSFMIFD